MAARNAVSGSANAPFAIYLTRVRQQLEKYKVFPSAARDRRETGEVSVIFSIAANGRAVAVTDPRGGSPLLQRAAVELVATQRFPPPPAGWDPARRLIIPIKYTLQ